MVAITTLLEWNRRILILLGPAWVASMIVGPLTDRVLAADWPEVLKIAVEETEECFFDGEYDQALRHLDQAETWLERPANLQALLMLGEDHGLVKSILRGLKAQILSEKGETKKAESAIDSANSILMNRRSFRTRQGTILTHLWKYEAFLLFLEGDLYRSSPDFGLADNLSIPETLRVRFANQSNPKRSLAAYNKANDVLTRTPAAMTPDLLLQRLRGRLLIGLAHGALYKTGIPNALDCRDAGNYLDRAEDVFRQNPFWTVFLAPDAVRPVSYKELEKQPNLTPEQKVALKRDFYRAIQDWLSLKLMRTELSAGGELAGVEQKPNTRSAEQGYAVTLGFCRAHFPSIHPTLYRVMLSRSRWFTYLDCSLEKLGGKANLPARISLLQDCIFDVTRIRMNDRVDARTQSNCDTLELNAITRLLDIDAAEDVLPNDKKEKYHKRKLLLEQRIAQRDKKPVAANVPDVPEDEK